MGEEAMKTGGASRFHRARHIHFVGIGGIGMSGIAEVLLNLGYQVSGSDAKASPVTERLESLGVRIGIGHDPGHVEGAHVVVRSSAVKADNPEVEGARRRGIPVIPRAEMLAELMRMKQGLAVAGTHGKTTTTSLLATCLAAAGMDPTVVVGGKVKSLDSNARLGQGDYLVAEADESDGSFLKLSPTLAVVTNIDPEHLDHYGTFDAVKDAFLAFINKVPFYGAAVLCIDHPVIQGLLPHVEKRALTYGFSAQAEFRGVDVRLAGPWSHFRVLHHGEELGEITLHMPGRHNVQNALGVIAVGVELDIPWEVLQEALQGFTGVGRRFEVKGEVAGVMVVDDYGHHPVEIRATLRAAREGFPHRLLVAFQPHRFSRLRDLWEEFLGAFGDADFLLVAPVYAAGEGPMDGITSDALVESLRQRGNRQVEVVPRKELAARLQAVARAGDMVVTLGAGDITLVGDELLARLREEAKSG